jgi:predicted nucleotidyltransferase
MMAGDGTLAEMTARLFRDFQPARIILFGSQARGDARPDSDFDLLIVGAWTGSRHEIAARMYHALQGLGVAKDLILVTPEEFESDKHYPGTVSRPAWLEGRVLYDRAQ